MIATAIKVAIIKVIIIIIRVTVKVMDLKLFPVVKKNVSKMLV